MKKTLSTLCAVMMCMFINAQTIHWLTFIDTTDPNVGQIDVFGRQMLYSYFINEVNAALWEKGYKSDIQDHYGALVTPENCKDAIEMLTITNPDDIIVFYYIGHGGRPLTEDDDYKDEHPYPQMNLAQGNPNKFVPLEWVDKQLSSKGARLSVTIGMCCNSLSDIITMKDEPDFSPNYGEVRMSANKRQRIQELFLNMKGHVIATSASPGQPSGCFQVFPSLIPNPACLRDRYSYAICSFFQTQLDNYNEELTWDKFLNKISWFVDYHSGHQQTPFHNIYLAEAPEVELPEPEPITDEQIEVTQQRQTSNETIQQGDEGSRDWINELTNFLSTLTNVNLPHAERRALEKSLNEELFAENAIVRFLGQESNTVIDKSTVSDWLGILATNPGGRILKVIVEEGSFDSDNRIKSLKVREIYKQ